MATIKAYLYCAKAGEKLVRYSKELFEKKLDDTDEETYEMCCKYGNGEKDLEIRKSCPKEIKVISNGS